MLNELIAAEISQYALVFARLGSAMMVLPFFGDGHVNSRVRLFIALGLTLALGPILAPDLPAFPESAHGQLYMIALEVITGLFIGGFTRLAIAALHLAGGIIAMQMGFAAANFFDANSGAQSSTVSNFLTVVCVTLMVTLDGHHAIIAALAGSYATFQAGALLPAGDMANAFATGLSAAMTLAFQIAAPITIMAIIANSALGVLNRMVPTMHVIFVALPLQILLGLGLLGMSVAGSSQRFLVFLEQQLLVLAG